MRHQCGLLRIDSVLYRLFWHSLAHAWQSAWPASVFPYPRALAVPTGEREGSR